MDSDIKLDTIYLPSDEIVARIIEGDLVIVPLTAGIGDMEDELYSLNETGKCIWALLDGKRTLNGVINDLSKEFDDPTGEIQQDVLGLVTELVHRKMLTIR